MPAKKRTTDKKTVAELTELLELVTAQWKETKVQLAEANELLKKGQETMREHAGGDVELMEALTAERAKVAEVREFHEDRRLKLVAVERELEFWVEESDRYRNQVVELLRALVVEQAKREVSS